VDKKETAIKAEELGRKIEDGEITINQARVEMGLNPLNDKGADELLKRA